MVAGCKVVVLSHWREEVRLIIRRHAFTGSVKDHRGVIDLAVTDIGYASGNNVDLELCSQAANCFLCTRAVLI